MLANLASHTSYLSLFGLTKSHSFLQVIFADVWAPLLFLSSEGHHFILVFVDDFSGYTWCYPLFRKSDVLYIFAQFQVLVERQFNAKIKATQTDWGGEF